MDIKILTSPLKKDSKEHPSTLQRKKLAEAKKLRLEKALRDNLRKRKEQLRIRQDIK
ncbi:MAG: hypothetical protein JSR85_01405 [Proteobacteria bacterium]|nr:hypothetical protein [Pseudomonadota bacterium]